MTNDYELYKALGVLDVRYPNIKFTLEYVKHKNVTTQGFSSSFDCSFKFLDYREFQGQVIALMESMVFLSRRREALYKESMRTAAEGTLMKEQVGKPNRQGIIKNPVEASYEAGVKFGEAVGIQKSLSQFAINETGDQLAVVLDALGPIGEKFNHSLEELMEMEKARQAVMDKKREEVHRRLEASTMELEETKRRLNVN
jgi:hypothetical protein